MLSINNLSFFLGDRALYENANLHIKPKDRIALIGVNGSGKSTLLRIIMGEYLPDAGAIEKSKDCTIGFLNQDLLSYQSDNSILEVAMEAFERQNQIQKEMDEIIHRLETDYKEDDVEKLTHLQEIFEKLDGYLIQSKSEEILEGLGFKTADLSKPLRNFSGGWRMRVMLAKLLLQKPSLLMLDEPTNHLDLPSIKWLEQYLTGYQGAVIVVSHDMYFLDRMSSITVEISQKKMNYYSGNYSFYLEEKQLRKEIQQSAFENQQDYIRQQEKFIERFKAKASKSRQVQSRVKQLNKLDLVDEVIDEKARVNFKFNFSQTSGKVVCELKNVSKEYPNLPILDHTEAIIEKGDKIALVGANGKGKSTLLRVIAGTEDFNGERNLGYNVLQTFFAQHQLEALRLDNQILEELKQLGSAKTETELRNILGCFLFKDEDVFKKIKVLSGGEKSRVALAKVMLSEANFLLLDEPTNHLDMQSINILIQALIQYQGTFLVVSHDRHFVNEVANKIWYIEDFKIKQFLGGFEEFEEWNNNRILPPQSKEVKEKPIKTQEIVKKSMAEQDSIKKEVKKKHQILGELEKEIDAKESEIKKLEEVLSNSELFKDKAKYEQTNKEYQKAKEILKSKQADWEKQASEIDELEMVLKD